MDLTPACCAISRRRRGAALPACRERLAHHHRDLPSVSRSNNSNRRWGSNCSGAPPDRSNSPHTARSWCRWHVRSSGSDAIGAWAAATKTRRTCCGWVHPPPPQAISTQRILASAQASPRGFDVELHQLDWDDQTRAVTDGRVDAAFVRRPTLPPRAWCTPVFAEPRRHAPGRSSPRGPGLHHVRRHRGRGLHAQRHRQPRLDRLLAGRATPRLQTGPARTHCLVGGGNVGELRGRPGGIAITAGSVPKFYAHPQVRFVPVDDLSPNHVVLAVAADDARTVVADFQRLVATVARAAGPGDR